MNFTIYIMVKKRFFCILIFITKLGSEIVINTASVGKMSMSVGKMSVW
jgi:hypothetical protein